MQDTNFKKTKNGIYEIFPKIKSGLHTSLHLNCKENCVHIKDPSSGFYKDLDLQKKNFQDFVKDLQEISQRYPEYSFSTNNCNCKICQGFRKLGIPFNDICLSAIHFAIYYLEQKIRKILERYQYFLVTKAIFNYNENLTKKIIPKDYGRTFSSHGHSASSQS